MSIIPKVLNNIVEQTIPTIVSPVQTVQPFISIWNTVNTPGVTASDQVLLPLESSGTYNFEVDWGDGNSDTITAWNQAETTHTYSSSGVYTITIVGIIEGWRFNNGGDRGKIIEIQQWGCLRLGNNNGYFYGCGQLANITATDTIDLTGTTNLQAAFQSCSKLITAPSLSQLDVSNVTNCRSMFQQCNQWNQELDWGSKTSNVTIFQNMFLNDTQHNQPINFDFSSAITTSGMFWNNSSFNQDVSNFDVSNASVLESMFQGCSSLDPDIRNWQIQNVGNMNFFASGSAFGTTNYDAALINFDALALQNSVNAHFGNAQYSAGAPATARANIISGDGWTITDGGQVPFTSTWQTDNPGASTSTQITLPLESTGTYNFNVDWGDGNSDTITAWNQAEVTHDYGVGNEGSYIVTITGTIDGWRFNNSGDSQKITQISKWGHLKLGNSNTNFYGCSNLTVTATDILDTDGKTNWSQCFRNCTSLTSVPSMDSWDMSTATNISSMFQGATLFNQDLNSWDTSSVTTASSVFSSASSFNGNIASWDMSGVTVSIFMFSGASAFNQDISSWDMSNVTLMGNMFLNATSFNQPIGSWTTNMTNAPGMFQGATSFNQNLNSWNTSNLGAMFNMFSGASSYDQPMDNWDFSAATSCSNMLLNSAFSQTNYDPLLISLDGQTLNSSVNFHAGSAQYGAGAPATARANIISTYSWTITDGGPA